jgi:hypothetical protein
MMEDTRQLWDHRSKHPQSIVLEDRTDRNHVEKAMVTFSKARRSEIHPGSSTARPGALGRFTR